MLVPSEVVAQQGPDVRKTAGLPQHPSPRLALEASREEGEGEDPTEAATDPPGVGPLPAGPLQGGHGLRRAARRRPHLRHRGMRPPDPRGGPGLETRMAEIDRVDEVLFVAKS